MGKIFVAATASGKLLSVAAAAVLLASGWVGTVQAETLASWTLTEKLNDSNTINADEPLNESLLSATLARAAEATAAGSSNRGFGAKYGSAVSGAKEYFNVSLTTASHSWVLVSAITNYIYKSASGPQTIQWNVLMNGESVFTGPPISLGSSEITYGNAMEVGLDLSNVQALGNLPEGTLLTFQILGASAGRSGTLNLYGTMNVYGTANKIEAEHLTLDEIDARTIECGEMHEFDIGISGANGESITFAVTAKDKNDNVFAGDFDINASNGRFSYTPAKADAILSPITFTIEASTATQTAEPQSFDVMVNVIPPAIGEIEAQQCYAGDTNIVALTLSGDYAEVGEVVSTNAICQTYGITGQFSTNITDGVFWYAPSMEDIAIAEENEGVIGFKVVLTVGDLAATNEFNVAVSEKPDFFEGFEKIKTSTTYINTENTILEGDAASWRGTNYLVNGRASDNFRGTRAVCFRDTGTAYIEMATSKANGAGTVSFWHGRVPNDATQTTNLLEVFISNNGGSTWNSLTEDAIVVSNEFVKTTIEDVNVGGNVMLRFVKTYGSKRMYIDDIIITDYEGQAVIEPAIGEINNRAIHADESVEIQIEFYGDDWLTKSVECTTPGVANEEYGFDAATGDFSFNPSLGDLSLNGGVIGFTAFLKNGDVVRASRSFTVTLLPPLSKWLELQPNTFIRENFNSMGTDTDAELPAPWRVAHTNTLFCTNSLSYGEARQTTEKRATNASGAISIGNAGIYNMGTNEQDRAVGFLSANGSSSQYRTCALMVPVKNTGAAALGSINVRYNVEKWRKGHGKTLALCISTDGVSWTVAGDEWKTETSEDTKEENGQTKTDTTVLEMGADPLLKTISGKLTLPEPLAAGDIVYLGWFYMSNDANCASAQALAVDNVRISAGNPDMTVIIMK